MILQAGRQADGRGEREGEREGRSGGKKEMKRKFPQPQQSFIHMKCNIFQGGVQTVFVKTTG